MNLVSKQVVHKVFGKGSVIRQDESCIEINFKSGDKKFIYPDAFESFLTLTDKKAAESVRNYIDDVKEERLIEEAALEIERENERKEQEDLLHRQKLMENFKIHPSSQAAFWIKDDHDSIFSDWQVFTGLIKSGLNEGNPNKPVRLHRNSACLLTERKHGSSEKNRRIIGVFMVGDNFVGKLCDDGLIPAHEEYRFKFSEDEANQLLFWNYYVNEKYPTNTTWNTGRYRYFENIWMAQILRDISTLKKNTPDAVLAQKFFEHFTHINQIRRTEIPDPNGALKRTTAPSK